MYQIVATHKGFNITVDDEGKFHVAQTFKEYNSLDEVKSAINEILAAKEARELYLQGDYEQVFDEHRGMCLKQGEELYTIHKLESTPEDHDYLRGKEYFHIDNPYGSKYVKSDLVRKLFSGRIKDAVEAIRNGYGDLILTNSFFGIRSEDVIRFVDREVGERVRAEVIKGFKDAKFITILRMYVNQGWGYQYDIGENGKLVNGKWMEYTQPMAFESEDAAYQYGMELTEQIQKRVAEITEEELCQWMTEEDYPTSALLLGVEREYSRLHTETEEERKKNPFNFEVAQALVR